jgi:steroid delta-isomerase-like uncharacterized protein
VTAMNPDDLVKKWMDGIVAYNDHELGPYVALMDPNYVVHNPLFPKPIEGKEAVIDANEHILQAFPDFQLRVLDIVSNGDVVALQYVLTGTFTKALLTPAGAIPPTGRRFEIRTAEFDRINSNGLISEAYVYYYDLARFRQQLGLNT